MSKIWREIPALFLSYALKLSIGAFILFGVVHSAVLAVYDNSYGMIEGIGIGITLAFIFFYIVEFRGTQKQKKINSKVKELIREANSCFQLASNFEKEGKFEAQRQFVDDYNRKRTEILSLLGGEVNIEDIK